MEEEEVVKQLDQMVKFIYREADEKASEISAKAREEFSIEKSRIVNEEKAKIAKTYDTKEKAIEVKKKIAYSNELNQSRIRVLRAKEESVQKLLTESHKKLAQISKNQDSYRKLLKDLIVQSLIKLGEPTVKVLARKEDVSLVQSVLSEAVSEYTSKTHKTANVTLDNSSFLPPGPQHGSLDGEFCSGGVVLATPDGKIVCSNTLDDRLKMAFEGLLPEIRTILFGASLTRVHRD
eukprot:TRINITY_DN2853_c0_g1_i1.p1 TRINITY_DN2853_c0_g1~~TRINITY_DN2853_c0_g1_i1.p1  ORF type:complete len:235 (-),score=75.39 TRINITY_DN2853_c0_g1_i1:147-851(-)